MAEVGKLKGLFEPIFLFFPINVISEFATPVSLSLRLFANILSGTMMMALIYGLLPKFLFVGLAGCTTRLSGCICRRIASVCIRYADNGIHCECRRFG